MKIVSLHFLLLCLLPTVLPAQFEPVKNFSVKDGLPSGIVYDCLQDKQGFMWFATAAGLARFDGTNFKVFTTPDGLTNNEVLQIALDKDGSIWIFPFGATACIYDAVTQRIYNEKNYDELKKISNLSIQLFVRPSAAGLVGYSLRKVLFFENKRIRILDTLHTKNVKDAWPINKDSLILFTEDNKSYLFTGDRHTEINFPKFETGLIFSRSPDWGRWKIFINSNLTTRLKLYEYQNDGLIERANFKSEFLINSIYKQGDKIYIATTGGYYITDTLLSQTGYFFPGKNISRIFIDNKANEWICSLSGEGVYMRLKNNVKQFDINSGLPADNISTLKMDQHNLLISGDGYGNIYTIDPKDKDMHPQKIEKFAEAIRGLTLYQNSYIAYSTSMLKIKEQRIAGDIGAIKSVLPDTNGNLLVGTHQSLRLYNVLKKEFEIIKLDPRFATLCYSHSKLYYGNNKGLFRIETLNPYRETEFSTISDLLTKPINHLSSTKDGLLWIATNSDGVIAFKNDKIIGHFSISSQPSLTSNICKKLYVDEENQMLWIATNKGVNRVNYTLFKDSLVSVITAFTSSEGLNDDDVNDIFVKDGKGYAATIKGICIFDANLSRKEIPVVLTDITIKKYLRDSNISSIKESYKLSYQQNDISISYSGICYTCNERINYQYRLLGIDNDTTWKSTTANTIVFGELSAGNYIFQVRTGNSNMQQVSFSIKPPFWKTTWFYVLMVLAGAGFFYLSVQSIVRRIKKRELEKTAINKRFAELEFQALQAQMNPHFIFNVMNTLQNFILKNESEVANEYLSRFARLMRLFLDSSRDKFITLEKEIELLTDYIELEQARLQPKFNYQIIVELGIEPDRKIPSAIIQPFVENAIVHGLRHRTDDKGDLKIVFRLQEQTLECKIQDNGIGRRAAYKIKENKNKQYQSQGIKIINEKIKTLKEIKDIDIHVSIDDTIDENTIVTGTTVLIRFGQTK